MITYEMIKSANERVERTNIKGKKYAEVPARVQAFREICPDGAIITEIISHGEGMIVMRATVMDETGRVLGTGHAYEKEGSSQINRTSYVENCETSAVGRALAMIGIGSEKSMASAIEMQNAIHQQEWQEQPKGPQYIGEDEQKTLQAMCEKRGLDPAQVFKGWPDLTPEQYVIAVRRLSGE